MNQYRLAQNISSMPALTALTLSRKASIRLLYFQPEHHLRPLRTEYFLGMMPRTFQSLDFSGPVNLQLIAEFRNLVRLILKSASPHGSEGDLHRVCALTSLQCLDLTCNMELPWGGNVMSEPDFRLDKLLLVLPVAITELHLGKLCSEAAVSALCALTALQSLSIECGSSVSMPSLRETVMDSLANHVSALVCLRSLRLGVWMRDCSEAVNLYRSLRALPCLDESSVSYLERDFRSRLRA